MEILLFSEDGKAPLLNQKSLDFKAAWIGNTTGSSSGKDNAHPGDGFASEQRKPGEYYTRYDQSNELPWIFEFGLRLIRDFADNKIVILTWLSAMVAAGLITVLVIKR